jgi:predicted helicase
LFETLGEDGIVFVPLMLQYIQCERNVSTEWTKVVCWTLWTHFDYSGVK